MTISKKRRTNNMQEKGLIIVWSGPAGSGKSTVRKLAENVKHFDYSVSATTRALRPGEVDGVDYVVYSTEYFKKLIAEGKLLEYTEYCGNYYGTPKMPVIESIEKGNDIILEIEVEGAKQVKKNYPDAVLIMLLPPDFKTQEARLRGRGTETEEKIIKRLTRTAYELDDVNIYDYVIYNYDNGAEQSAEDLLAIVRAEKCARRRRGNVKDNYYNNNN